MNMKMSEDITKIAPAMLAAQRAIGAADRDAANPFFHSKYATLEAVIAAVKGPLNFNGITAIQAVGVNGDNAPAVDTVLLHESGQWLATTTPIYCAKPNDPQAFGSGVTYSKRYALQAMLCLPTEDDDGEKAMARKSEKKAIEKKPPIDLDGLKSERGTAYLKKFPNVEAAIVALAETKEITLEAEAYIRETFDEAVMP